MTFELKSISLNLLQLKIEFSFFEGTGRIAAAGKTTA